MSEPQVIDADGHAYEDAGALIKRLPAPYRCEFEERYLTPQHLQVVSFGYGGRSRIPAVHLDRPATPAALDTRPHHTSRTWR
jgi:hypothetical protein